MGKARNSVIYRLIAVIVILICLMVGLLFYCNLYASIAVRKRVTDSYLAMGKYYIQDLDTRLYNITEYMAGVEESLEFYYVVYEEIPNDKYYLSKQALCQKLSQDILMYEPLEYFFIYSMKGNGLTLVPSATRIASADNELIGQGLQNMLAKNKNKYNHRWEVTNIKGEYYIYRYLIYNETCFGACVSVKQLLQLLGNYSLNDFSVSFLDKAENEAQDSLRDDLVIQIPSGQGNFRVEITVPATVLYEELNVFARQSISFVVILIVMIPVFFVFLHWIIVLPVRTMVHTMQKVEKGEIQVRMPELRNGAEFQLVSTTFNSMMDQISQLKIDVYEREIAKRELLLQCAKLQINPHFFLNSLNTLFLLNKRKENEKIHRILTYLLHYFRNIFSDTGDIVRLENEIDLTLNYVAVQRFRYGGDIHIQYEVEKEAEKMKVPSMIILTFVENSIKYSTDYSSDLYILLYVKKLEDMLEIRINDNGKGFPEEILDYLNEGKSIFRDGREHIGISNIVSRLKLYYGDHCTICFCNDESGGARVRMMLPINEREAE